jgi:hypothetical protein
MWKAIDLCLYKQPWRHLVKLPVQPMGKQKSRQFKAKGALGVSGRNRKRTRVLSLQAQYCFLTPYWPSFYHWEGFYYSYHTTSRNLGFLILIRSKVCTFHLKIRHLEFCVCVCVCVCMIFEQFQNDLWKFGTFRNFTHSATRLIFSRRLLYYIPNIILIWRCFHYFGCVFFLSLIYASFYGRNKCRGLFLCTVGGIQKNVD